ncbi:MAG: polysaccharide pyruvyl transferase family protein [Dehalococcoidia bacterium]|nr:polysaccharide pyruvyl transferase family protein [Dehalococcoidia bacterium]
MSRLILMAGAFGFGNLGDDAIALATSRLLAETAVDTQTVILGNTRVAIRRFTGLDGARLSWRSPRQTARLIALIRRSSAVLIGGGGLLQDVLPHFYRPYLLLAVVAKALRRPVMFYAVGVHPPRTSVFRQTLRLAANAVDVVTVRDEFSARNLRRAGVRRDVTVTADAAIVMAADGPAERASKKTLIGVSLRPWFHLDPIRRGGDPARLVDSLAQCLDAVVEAAGARLLFVPLQHGGADDDVASQREVISRMRYAHETDTATCHTPFDAVAAISHCDIVLGMRLHSNVLAAACGVPSIAIAYDPKVREFMKRLHCEEQVVGLDELRPAEVATRVRAALESRDEIKERIRPHVEEMQASARECAAMAARLAGATLLPSWLRSGDNDATACQEAA